jgi:hypothetical protein
VLPLNNNSGFARFIPKKFRNNKVDSKAMATKSEAFLGTSNIAPEAEDHQ